MLKHCWPTCSMVYNHRGCAMKFWLLDIILKPFAPVREMHYTTNTRHGRENWITTSKFKVSVADKGWLCLGNGDAVKRCWACAWRAVPADPEWVCSSQDLALCCGSGTVWVTIIPLLCSHSWPGGAQGTVGEMFKSTWMAWSALCHFWAWLTCSGTAAHRKCALSASAANSLWKFYCQKSWLTKVCLIYQAVMAFICLPAVLFAANSFKSKLLDHFSSVNSQLLSCKPPRTISVRV